MDLVHGEQIGFAQAELGGGPAAILAHVLRIVRRAVTAIERREETGADAALAGEEPMLHAGKVGERWGLDHGASGGRSEKPAGGTLVVSPSASTRNKVPIWSGAIKRSSAASMASACDGVARALSVSARHWMPMRRRKSPWLAGPRTRAPAPAAAAAMASKSTWALRSVSPGRSSTSTPRWPRTACSEKPKPNPSPNPMRP